MKARNSKAILKRLDELSAKTASDTPDITIIDRDGDKFSVVEHYYAPLRNKYKRLSFNSPDEYESKGGIVLHCYDLQD